VELTKIAAIGADMVQGRQGMLCLGSIDKELPFVQPFFIEKRGIDSAG
jgi:hypothetical protein